MSEGRDGESGGDVSEVLPDWESDRFADGARGSVREADDTDISVRATCEAPGELFVGAIEGAEEGRGATPGPAIAGDLVGCAGVGYCEVFEAFGFSDDDCLGRTVLHVGESHGAVDVEGT